MPTFRAFAFIPHHLTPFTVLNFRYDFMNPIFFFIGLFIFWIVLLAAVARFEKRMVWPYGTLQAQPPYNDIAGYGSRWVNEARGLEFSLLGWAPDLKGSAYQVSYGFLVSPQRDCLVIVGVGTIMKMKLIGTWVYTISADGRVLYSTDNQSCLAIDISRHWKTQLVRSTNFQQLLQGHQALVRDLQLVPRDFSNGQEMKDFKQLREEHYHTMARMGLIKFTDPVSTHWHYTIYGAIKLAALNYTIGLMRGMTGGRFPRVA